MIHSVQEVPLQYVHQVWPHVENFVAAALEFSQGDYTVRDVRGYLTGGQWSLVIATSPDSVVHGAAVVSYFNRPSHRIAFIVVAGGKFIANQDTWEQLEAIMRANGATYLECAVRDSVARLCARRGTQHKYSIVGKNLQEVSI